MGEGGGRQSDEQEAQKCAHVSPFGFPSPFLSKLLRKINRQRVHLPHTMVAARGLFKAMAQRMDIGRVMGREALLALLVLALVFLNFGHAAPSLASAYQPAGESSFCGDPAVPGDVRHAPCHACRIGGGADLPPPPCAPEAVIFASVPALFADASVPAIASPIQLAARPRGPPAI
jgi:hypothetical protein